MSLERFLKVLFPTLAALGCLAALIATPWDPRYILLGAILFAIVTYFVTEWVFVALEGGKELHQARRHAATLRDEAAKLLRRYSYRISAEHKAEVEAALKKADKALEDRALEPTKRAAEAVEGALKSRLAFARKSTIREYTESIAGAVFIALTLRAFIVEAFQIPSGSMIPTLQVGDYIFVSKSYYGLKLPILNQELISFRDKPSRGDIVVFVHPNPSTPNDEGKDLIKRIVAIEGDEVSMHHGVLKVNGQEVPRAFEMAAEIAESNPDARSPGGFSTRYQYTEDLFGVKHKVLYENKSYAGRASCGGSDSFSLDTKCWYRVGPTCKWGGAYCVDEKDAEKPFVVPPGHVFVMGDNRDDSDDSRSWGPVPIQNIKGKALFVWYSGSFFPPSVNAKRLFVRIE